MIPEYPEFASLSLDQRPVLHPAFKDLEEGLSEFSFANLYLFRNIHNYRISLVAPDNYVVSGDDSGETFFIMPFELSDDFLLNGLFERFSCAKCVTEKQAALLSDKGFTVIEDRDNFDYLYSRSDLAELAGNKYHKKKNLVKGFMKEFEYEGKPLLDEYIPDALKVLDKWYEQSNKSGDYSSAKEALENTEYLQLCGGIYYVNGNPVAFVLGEELANGRSFVIHFEKAVKDYRGLYQFINMSFALILPDKYDYINREQDLGIEGLRQAKMSYRPCGFVKKYRVMR